MRATFLSTLALLFISLAAKAESETSLLVSVPDQRLVVVQDGLRVAQYPVSTSKFGIGDTPRSYSTPLGTLQISEKIGAGAPQGAVFKARRPTGEVLRPNAQGRDPIVTRILWLRGLEAKNARAHDRGIYIHGTPVENLIGRPASYGCIRMRSSDVVRVFNSTPVGARVEIVNVPISRALHDVAAN
jgi:lipoprotein-anchoring transpeptidase ErfK/SrfK